MMHTQKCGNSETESAHKALADAPRKEGKKTPKH